MALTRFTLNTAGIGEILRSAAVLADVTRRADQIAAAAGPGHRVEAGVGPRRARAAVITDTAEAKRAEAERRSLSSAVGAGRS